jgi:hypothetical protein
LELGCNLAARFVAPKPQRISGQWSVVCHEPSAINHLSAVVSHEGGSTLPLLNHLLKLGAEHIDLSAH